MVSDESTHDEGTEQASSKTQEKAFREFSGEHYIHLKSAHRNACEALSVARIPFLGKRAPVCYLNLGRALFLLELAACCGFGCPGDTDPHRIQRLLGRVVSNANAGLALALGGYYDECLSLARNIGEIANLLWLFQNDNPEMARWETLAGPKRWQEFRPKSVRQKLEALGQPVLVDENEYSALSEVAAHVVPETAPQTLTVKRQPTLGGFYREDALVVCMNELGWSVGVACLPGGQLLLKGPDAKRLLEAGRALIGAVGGLRLRKIRDFWSGTTTNEAV